MDAVDDKVGRIALDDRKIARLRRTVGREPEFPAHEHAHIGRVRPLQRAGGGKIRRGVDDGDFLPLGEDAVLQIVVIEVFGDAVIGDAQRLGAGEHLRKRRRAVRGKCRMGVDIGQHTSSIARTGGKRKRGTAKTVPRRPITFRRGRADAPRKDDQSSLRAVIK